jgi:hypothetical protein
VSTRDIRSNWPIITTLAGCAFTVGTVFTLVSASKETLAEVQKAGTPLAQQTAQQVTTLTQRVDRLEDDYKVILRMEGKLDMILKYYENR